MDTKRKIIKYLKDGLSQKEISDKLKKLDIKPNSLSTIEKYIKEIRDIYNAKTLFHLACILYDKGELNFEAEEEE